METVHIKKLVHGGQGLGVLADGRKAFVWDALPGETVLFRVTKKCRDYIEGVTEEIVQFSKNRERSLLTDVQLSTHPWAMLGMSEELAAKDLILREAFLREGVELTTEEFVTFGSILNYRNKMEYGFWGDEKGVKFAHFRRGSHGKISVTDSLLTDDPINDAGHELLDALNHHNIRASDLKSVILRSNRKQEVAAALFVKDESFKKLPALKSLKGLVVYFSNPKSPASIPTRELFRQGDTVLTDTVCGTELHYDVLSFFQVNLPVFEKTMEDIRKNVDPGTQIIDMYSGVGTIGLCVGAQKLIEFDEHNVAMARANAGKDSEVIVASSEKALDNITSDSAVIFDPPRAGLHAKVVERINETSPPKIVYLSCNPSTQARDIAQLIENYKIKFARGYNFFPRTPHIESLVILERI